MMFWSSWNSVAQFVPQFVPWVSAGAALAVGLVIALAAGLSWKPKAGKDVDNMPALLRWLPALLAGGGSAALAYFAVPAAEQELQLGAAAGLLLVVTGLIVYLLGRTGERVIRAEQASEFWRRNAEGVTSHLRRTLNRQELLDYAVKSLLEEMESSAVRLFLPRDDRFELAAAKPAATSQESFAKDGPLASALAATAWDMPFLELAGPKPGRAAPWQTRVKGADPAALLDEQARLDGIGGEFAVGFRREGLLGGFFILSGRVFAGRVVPARRAFAVDVASQLGRMLDVLGAAEKMAQERAERERDKADAELATLVRRRMTPPDMAEVAGLEYGVSVEPVPGSRAGFCDAVVLPGSALGVVMAETGGGGLQAAVEMVRLQALLRSRFYVYGEDLREMLDSVERALRAGESTLPPINLLLGRYHAPERRFVYVNAGYLAPVLLKRRSDGSETRRLASTGRPLAAVGPADWTVQEIELRRRDVLLAISPGLLRRPDALERWGENRLMETMLELEKLPAPAIAHRLVKEAAEVEDPAPLKSERSAIVLRPTDAAVRPLAMPSPAR